ncbi:Uncharacterised protein [Mycobacterium tuberculosis]|nr:Uncharacterised protein [Mycobacterium tuberculosis]
MLEPLARAAALGELLAEPQPVGQRGERVVVVAGVGIRRHHRRHCDQGGIGLAGGEVVALETGGGWHHNVGVFGHRGPILFVYHDRVYPRQCTTQPRQVLVVVERISTGPVDALDVGQLQQSAVVGQPLAGPLQQLTDRRHRNERRHRIVALRQCRQAARQRRVADAVAAVAVTETPSGKPDLAQHRR